MADTVAGDEILIFENDSYYGLVTGNGVHLYTKDKSDLWVKKYEELRENPNLVQLMVVYR